MKPTAGDKPAEPASDMVAEMRDYAANGYPLEEPLGKAMTRFADALEAAERGAARMIGERGELLFKLEAASRRCKDSVERIEQYRESLKAKDDRIALLETSIAELAAGLTGRSEEASDGDKTSHTA